MKFVVAAKTAASSLLIAAGFQYVMLISIRTPHQSILFGQLYP